MIKNSIIKEIVTDSIVFNHLLTLQNKLNYEFTISQYHITQELLDALTESPNTTQWIKDVVLPGIYEGDDGLNNILNNIEDECHLILRGAKMKIIMDILHTLEEPLYKMKEGFEMGQYSLENNLKIYEDKRPFKTLH